MGGPEVKFALSLSLSEQPDSNTTNVFETIAKQQSLNSQGDMECNSDLGAAPGMVTFRDAELNSPPLAAPVAIDLQLNRAVSSTRNDSISNGPVARYAQSASSFASPFFRYLLQSYGRRSLIALTISSVVVWGAFKLRKGRLMRK